MAGPHALHVVLEADKRGGLFTEGRDTYAHFVVEYAHVDRTDWAATIHGWMTEVAHRRGIFF